MRAYIFIACIVVAAATTHRFEILDSELNDEWSLFKKSFNKKYPTQLQETIRRIQWKKNVEYIQQHNMEADLGKHTYRLGINQFADLSVEEYRKLLLPRTKPMTSERGSTFLPPSNIDLPKTVDWRPKGYVTGVKTQGNCSSCWAFSAAGSLEGQHFKKTGKLVSLSAQNLVDCSTSFGNGGCQFGGEPDFAFKYIKANGGIDTEKSYPYEAVDGKCRFKRADVGAIMTGFTDIMKGSEDDLQKAVATVGPISVGIDASLSSFRFYKGGIYNEPACQNRISNHAVLAVGYGTEDDDDYWLVKNSWGTAWGESGYIKMSRNKNNQCGIATHASYPLV